MNAVIYCRVSSKEQVEGTSLESQEIACKEYAARNHMNVARVFVERGESAKFADRTQLLELLAYCSKRGHGVDCLLVWKVDRLARNVGDHYNIKASLLKQNVRVISVTEPIDANPEGKLLETILAGFAQFDNDLRAARTLQGMRRKIQEGLFPWKPPIGYKSAIQPGSKKTEPDQPDQPAFGILQLGWNEFATGAYTKAQILRLMTSRGLRTRTGKHLSKQALDYIFCDPFYAGILRDPWAKENHLGRHLPMVSRETFNKVQQVIVHSGQRVPHRAVRAEFPLRTFVRCFYCEHALTGSFSRGRSKVYPYYQCYFNNCNDKKSYPSEVVHEEFTGYLARTSADQHTVDHLAELLYKAISSNVDRSRVLIGKKLVEAKRIKEQQQQLFRIKMDQLITDEEFLDQKSQLTAKLAEAEAAMSEPEAKPEDIFNDIDIIGEPLMDLGGTWKDLTTDLKRRFQHMALPAGYVIGRIGTAQKSRLFSFLESPDAWKTSLVPLTCQSWNQLAHEIKTFAAIFRESEARA